MLSKGSLATLAATTLVVGVITARFAMSDWSGRSPLASALAALLFCLLIAYVIFTIVLPAPERKHRTLPPSLREALRKRSIGGTNFTLDQRLLIDREGIFETRLGLISWSQVVGLNAVRMEVGGNTVEYLQVCSRDPWRYLDQLTPLQILAQVPFLSRDARYGRLDIVTCVYRVDLDIAHQIARGWRRECPEPFLEAWRPSMSEVAIGTQLREAQRRLERPGEATADAVAASTAPGLRRPPP